MSNGRRIGLPELVTTEDFDQGTDSTDEDMDGLEEALVPLDDDVDVLDLSHPPVFKIESVVVSEVYDGGVYPQPSRPGRGERKDTPQGTRYLHRVNYWHRRKLNNIKPDNIDFCSLRSDGSIVLKKGTYNIIAKFPSIHNDASVVRIRREVNSQSTVNNEWMGSSLQAENEATAAVTQFGWVFASVAVDSDEDIFYFEQTIKLGYASGRGLGAEAKMNTPVNETFTRPSILDDYYTQVLITRLTE
ncbi:hypothetical protein [Moorena sp. SIO3A2]|uniref:hypothetical protein n=1 Tax=Moorena sp. SIO3A2 TaxID=2607841 RepID=UPI0013B9448F|nr:hypothetical protein [Moorena sp. SIO3A2]NER90352.1 hypothetical protein [Moorena sp. SIO3A2]